MTNQLVILRKDEEFQQFRKAKSFSSPSLKLRARLNHQNFPRFGFIIPKKTMAKVTDRNKVKRRLKAILQKHLTEIKAADLLLFPAKTALKLKFADLEKQLIDLFKQAKLWNS